MSAVIVETHTIFNFPLNIPPEIGMMINEHPF